MLTKHLFASTLIAFTLIPGFLPIPGLNIQAQAADIEQYRRKYISFFPSEDSSLDEVLQAGMGAELPRFTYQMMKPTDMDLLTFLQAVKRFQKEHAGELAALKEKDNIKFGDKVVPWSETKQVMESAYVFSPEWRFSDIRLTGPHKHEQNKSTYWAVHAESDLDLSLDIFKLTGEEPSKYATEEERWTLTKELKLNNLDSLLRKIKEATGVEIDMDNPLHRPLVLEALKLLPEFSDIEDEEPSEYLADEVEAAVNEDSFGALATAIKRLEDFILKGDVTAADMKADQVKIGFGDKETPASLGVKMDHGYKLIEYRMQNGQEVPVEVGFMKVRELGADKVSAQPIIVARDYELGDQVKEYPKSGINVGLKAGTTSLGFSGTGEPQNMFSPQVQLDIESNMASLTGVSELYGTLTGGVALPVTAKFDSNVSALGATVEIGVLKKFYMRQLIFNAGIRGGVLMGFLKAPSSSVLNTGLDSSFVPGESYSNMGFGATALIGLHYQATADVIFGLDLGYRIFMGSNEWKTGKDSKASDANLGGLSSNGPVINLFANFAL